MHQTEWDRIQEIYHAALAVPRSERNAFVAKACADNSECLSEVKSLLEAADSSKEFLNTPIFRLSSMTDNLVGITIADRYRIERPLGSGGMSRVYYAIDERLSHQPVVVKILSEDLLKNSYVREHFDQEVEALLRIDHHCIVRVLDKGRLDDGRPFIVMQYVDGETLRSQIPNHGMDRNHAASILKQMGEALEHIHGKRIFHRDLKPENIMLKRGTDSLVLIDFGIAKVHNSNVASTTVSGTSIGTLAYMSPEQHQGQGITSASDIYAMGVIAFELITGRRPFNGTSSAHYVELQRAGVRLKPMQLCEGLSRDAQDLILQALSFDPTTRPKNAGEFGNHLADALRKSEVPASQPRRLKRSVVSFVVLVALAALSFGVYKWCKRDQPPLNHQFSYWLTIQRMRDGKDYEEPYKSNDDATFNSGDKFRLNVMTPKPGYLYVLNEGPPESNNSSFTMLYPRKSINNGASSLGANQSVECDWITFRGPAGAENLWIVWSIAPVEQLESVKQDAFGNPNAALTDNTLVTVREYLKAKQAEIKVKPTRYKETQKVTVRSPADLLVMLAQIKHR